MSPRHSALTRCLLLLITLLVPAQAFSYGGVTSLQYVTSSGVLSGYSATWRDPWDTFNGSCCLEWYYEMGDCAVALYYENWVSVVGRLYTPTGGQYGYDYYDDDWYLAIAPYVVVDAGAGVWTGSGGHYIEQDVYLVYNLWGYFIWELIGTNSYYLGPTLAQVNVQPCPLPTGESTSYEGWIYISGSEGGKFRMTLLSALPGQSFTGRQILETFGEAIDGCYAAYPNQVYPPMPAPPSGSEWTVDSGNTYGLDVRAEPTAWFDFYRQNILNPCSHSTFQPMKISDCAGGNSQFYEPGHQFGLTVYPQSPSLSAFRNEAIGYK